jgi:hypothetical protein
MDIPTTIAERADSLTRHLKGQIRYYRTFQYYNTYLALLLMWGALSTTAIASIGGMLNRITAQWLGAMALVPASAAAAARVLRLQRRAEWHSRKAYALEALYNRLRYESGDSISGKELAEVSQALAEVNQRLDREWSAECALDWHFPATRERKPRSGKLPHSN